MIDRKALLADLEKLLEKLEDDFRAHLEAAPEANERVAADYLAAKAAGRTAQTENTFRDEQVTQAAVAWILAAVFVRFLEDNDLVTESPGDPWPRISGPNAPSDRLRRAKDSQTLFFQQHPKESDREFLLDIYKAVARLPGMSALIDETTNPLFRYVPSADGATLLLEFFRKVDPSSGAIVHDFTDPELRTRFLGDLYQDLSAVARDKYALLQTPDFVQDFLLDRTLEPAIREFGLAEATLIDPTCGSGHFLLGAFERLVEQWRRAEPGTNVRELVRRALSQVSGVDINPFAIAIARFRLLVAAIQACGIRRLVDAPDFKFDLAVGDSLLFGRRPRHGSGVQRDLFDDKFTHHYASEDPEAVRRILERTYSVVVGNPPYIIARDAALNAAYRARFESCHRKFSLVVPFVERFFDLAHHANSANERAGYVAMIAANAFMKREFGKKLVESYLPNYDMTCVVDTSGAYIPGHGTPTVLLLARDRWPVAKHVRAVLGIRGEPGTPEDPARGRVWSEIVEHIEQPGFEGSFVSVADIARERSNSHPWSMGGGGAADLREQLDEDASAVLSQSADSIGFGAILGEDDAFERPIGSPSLRRLPAANRRPLIVGDHVRDWCAEYSSEVLFAYDQRIELVDDPAIRAWLWTNRTILEGRADFSNRSYREAGRPYWEYHQIPVERNRTPLSITFGEVATHNHFVLDRGGKVFKQTAPVIKLPAGASEEEHLGLLGILNSSTACFWFQQVCHNKGGPGGANSKDEKWHDFYQLNGTKLEVLPLPVSRPYSRTARLDELSARRAKSAPGSIRTTELPSAARLQEARQTYDELFSRMISEQDELDWECYRLYGLVDEDLFLPPGAAPPLRLGERAFEIVLACRLAAGQIETKWFERHGSTPITEIPAHWPDAYKKLVARRIEVIASNANIRLIEQPEYKRRWNQESWEDQEQRALRSWLLDRLEDPKLWPRGPSARSATGGEPLLRSTSELADLVRADRDFHQVAELYAGRPDFDLSAVVRELVESEAVPYLPVLRYKDSGLRKRVDWEKTWEFQRKEDAIDVLGLSAADAKAKKKSEIGDIAVPPKYGSGDFLKATYWRLRGKLDVPKERFVAYPFASKDTDPSLVITWAGYDHLEQGKALAAWYVARKESDGWPKERLQPLLLGLLDLLPWIHQWHPEVDLQLGETMGKYFSGFIDEEARSLGLTLEELRKWTPPEKARGRGRKKS